MKLRKLMDYVDLAAGHLENHNVQTARLDAEVILAHVLDVDRLTLYVQFDRPLNSDEVDRYRNTIARRAKGEPVAYITGQREFYSLPLKTDKRALIPRQDTEILVDEVLKSLQSLSPDGDPVEVADIGTGTGAIAIALAKSMDRVRVVAVDVDTNALQLAEENVTLNDVSDQVTLVQGNLLEPLEDRRFHAIVSNPPYIAETEWDGLATDVREYEPKIALVSGKDGLSHIRRIIEQCSSVLRPEGFLALEIGYLQGESVREIARTAGFDDVHIYQDLAGRDRVVKVGNNR